MAELLLKVGDGAGYLDGDILCAFSRLRIRCVHAEHICHIKHTRTTSEGLRPINSLAAKFLEATQQYKTRRIGKAAVERVNLFTGDVEELDFPHLEEYLRRRLLHERHRIFGRKGREVWFGGESRVTHTVMDNVWNAIETDTPHREATHRRWPLGRMDKRHHLAIAVDDFDETVAKELIAPEVDERTNEVALRRKRLVDFRSRLLLSGQDIDDIVNREREVDLRDRRDFVRASVVEERNRDGSIKRLLG